MSTMITHPASDTKPSSNRDTSDTQAEQTQHTLDEKATTASSANASPPGPPGVAPPPDGGLQAWLQVAAAFFAFFNTWGLLNTFGVYQTYYETGQLFRESSSNISWVGSVQAFLLLLVGGLTGPIFDKGYLRSQLLVGTFGIVFGHMMLSISKTFWQVILSQGFVIGIGAGFLFVPAIAILPTYFARKKGLALGLAAAGSSMGGVIYPIVFYRLISQIGFGWSVRVLGFIALATQILPIAVMKQRIKPQKARALLDTTVFTDINYLLFVLGVVVGFIGLYCGLFYISFYASATGITDEKLAFYLVPILNAASVFGRTLPNAFSDKTGGLNIIAPGALIVGIILFCFQAVSSVAGIVILTILFGFFSGVFIALPPVVLVDLSKHRPQFIGTRIGMAFNFIGCAVLAGGPGAGGILGNNRPGNWTGVWVYGGVACVCSSAIFLLVRWRLVKFRLSVKV